MIDYSRYNEDKKDFILNFDILYPDEENRKIAIHYADSKYDEVVDYTPEKMNEIISKMEKQVDENAPRIIKFFKKYIFDLSWATIFFNFVTAFIVYIFAVDGTFVARVPMDPNVQATMENIGRVMMTTLLVCPSVILDVFTIKRVINAARKIKDAKKNLLFLDYKKDLVERLNLEKYKEKASKKSKELIEHKNININDIDKFKYHEVNSIVNIVENNPDLKRPKRRIRIFEKEKKNNNPVNDQI